MIAAKRLMRAERALPYLACLIASCISAALAHASIGVAGDLGAGGDAYAEHEHGALGPVALTALLLIGGVLLSSTFRALSRRAGSDPLLLLARRFASRSPIVPCIAVTLGCLLLLIGMEFSEQVSATGHLEGVSDALGGNVATGTFILASVSCAVTWLGLRSARAIVGSAIAIATFLSAWILIERGPTPDLALFRRPARRRISLPERLAGGAGLRAPPSPQS